MSEEVLFHVVNNDVGVVTLNRPTDGNAYTLTMQCLLFDKLEEAMRHPSVKVVILTGSGKFFCVGASKTMLAGVDGNNTESTTKDVYRDITQAQMLKYPKPIIVALNGSVAGLGLVTACMGDVRFAVKSAKFSTAFAKRGLPAEHGISWILKRVVGNANAMDLMLSARVIDSSEALRMGLVSKLYDTNEDLMKGVMAYAKEIATWCSPASLVEMKEQMYEDLNIEENVAKSNELMKQSWLHPDFKEGRAGGMLNQSSKYSSNYVRRSRRVGRKSQTKF